MDFADRHFAIPLCPAAEVYQWLRLREVSDVLTMISG